VIIRLGFGFGVEGKLLMTVSARFRVRVGLGLGMGQIIKQGQMPHIPAPRRHLAVRYRQAEQSNAANNGQRHAAMANTGALV